MSRSIPYSLRADIKNYFEGHDGNIVFPSDIADDFKISYDLAVRLITDLERNGQVAKVG